MPPIRRVRPSNKKRKLFKTLMLNSLYVRRFFKSGRKKSLPQGGVVGALVLGVEVGSG